MINIRTPAFWYAESPVGNVIALLLLPFSLLYKLAADIRQRTANPYKSSLPVICVGNLTDGGSGKSPTAIALKELLEKQGIAKYPCFLTRGYKGSEHGPLLVDPDKHTAKDVGDEALMLAKHGSVIVASNRKEGAQFAEERRFDMIIMDDGFQNPQLEKDFCLITVNGSKGFGNKYVLPAGPLRQTLKDGLDKAHAVMIIGEDTQEISASLENVAVFHASFDPAEKQEIDYDTPCVAFAAIAHPDNFKDTLEKMGLEVVTFYAHADHKTLKESDELELIMESYQKQAQIITTEKDYVRLSAQFREAPAVTYLKMVLKLEDENALLSHITAVLRQARETTKNSDTNFD